MKTIKVLDNGETIEFQVKKGSNLLNSLRDNGYNIPALCNGRGVCNKCIVYIDGVEHKSCKTSVDEDMSVVIPDLRSIKVADKNMEYIFEGELPEFAIGCEYGLVTDIGTTTITSFIVDIKEQKTIDYVSFLNPQQSFGADVLSRMEHILNNEKGLGALQTLVINKINESIEVLLKRNKLSNEKIECMTVCGNTVMLHIFMGLDITGLARAPFKSVTEERKTYKASEMGIKINEEAKVIVLPCFSPFLGADIVAGVLACKMYKKEEISLLIDIGTNGEMVLGNKDFLVGCSTAAGPAFEGASIECGMAGLNGAIDNAYYDKKIIYSVLGDIKPKGICGSGVVDIMKALIDGKIVDETGYLEGNDMYPAFEMEGYNGIVIEKALNTSNNKDIIFTQKDVRQIQNAKGAIYAGIKSLLEDAGIGYNEITNVYLAGGFGSFINPNSAAEIGVLPKPLIAKVKVSGNTAAYGTLKYMLSKEMCAISDDLRNTIKVLDLACSMFFQNEYIDHLNF